MSEGFKAATWNVFVLTPVEDLKPTFNKLLLDGVTVILNQESAGRDITNMYQSRGWRTYEHGDNRISWDPEVWVKLSTRGIRLSRTAWFGENRSTPKFADAAVVRLAERDSKRTLKALSYHTPPHVQYNDSKANVPNRVQALRESMNSLGQLVEKSRGDALLFGGDDNVDENQGWGADTRYWSFMRHPATGLKLVQAPNGTLGNRRIDDFRVRGLDAGVGYVLKNASDHDLHVRRFLWK